MAGVMRKVAFFVLLLAVWQGVVSLKIWPPLLMPSPAAVAASLWEGTVNLMLPIAIVATMARMLVGYAIAVVIGVPLGLAIARVDLIRESLGSIALGLQTLPSICWLPLALLWFGLTEKAILFVVIMGAVFSIATAVDGGIRHVSPLLIKVGRTLGAEGMRLQWSVVVPAALPSIVTGLKLGWSFAWRSLMAGELLYSERGLGRVLMMGRDLGDMAQVLAAILVILALGLIVNRFVFEPMEVSLARRWGVASR